MKWVTRAYVHLDRVAAPWLIRRFVDDEAQFLFVKWGHEDERPADAVPFGIPGVELSSHDSEGSTFHKIAAKYRLLADPAISSIDKVIAAGVAYVVHGYRPESGDKYGQVAVGMLEIAEGMMLLDGGDYQCLELSFPIYDALYRNFRAHDLVESPSLKIPPHQGRGPEPKVNFLRELLRGASSRLT